MNQARALAIVGALISGASFSAGGVGGRLTAPAPPPQVELQVVPAASCAAGTIETAPVLPPELVAPPAPVEPLAPPAVAPPADVKPAPPAKVEAKPKAKPKPVVPTPKPRPAPAKRSLPSCAVIKREYERMNFAERLAAYNRADAEQIAHGRRCLGK